MTTTQLRALFAALLLGVAATGCESSKGPAEKAGEKIDKAADKVKESMDTRGPGEKAGAAVDKATGNR